MKRPMLVLAALLLAPAVHAQPPEMVDYLDMLEEEIGVKRLGPTFYGILEDDEEVTHVVPLAPDTNTFIQLACSGYCETVFGEAFDSSGESIARTEPNSIEPVLTIPAGHGDKISVVVNMVLCDDLSCPYVVQAFVR